MEPGCPEWQYGGHPRRTEILPRQVASLVDRLARRATDTAESARDTRPSHRCLFRELTPAGFEHYAGHYRGERLPCLRLYEVGIGNDPRVGYPALEVGLAMAQFADWVGRGLGALDMGREVPQEMNDEDRLLFVVALAAHFFQRLLTIHPYADGNGHAARIGVWAILLRYGYWPRRFPVEPRPPQPTYGQAIIEHRDGDPEALEKLILGSIVGVP